MWVRFAKDTKGSKKGDICWTDDDKVGKILITNGTVVRCIGPSGAAWNEVPPEDYISALAKEDKKTFKLKEEEIKKEFEHKEVKSEGGEK